MDINNPTSCLVEVDLVNACGRAFKAVIYAFSITIMCVIFCAAAVVSQLRQNRVMADARTERSTAAVVSSISKTQLLSDVRDYAQDARANKDAAHDLVVNARLGIAPAPSN